MKRITKNNILLKTAVFVMAAVIILSLIAVFPQTTQAAGKATISRTYTELATGKTLQLTVDMNADKVAWKSSDTSVATVSSKGLVTAKKYGKTTITASGGGQLIAIKQYFGAIRKALLKAMKREPIRVNFAPTILCRERIPLSCSTALQVNLQYQEM